METLRQICTDHGLCPQALGLESGKGACFAYQIKQCKGLCAGRETPALHRVRLQMALAEQRLLACRDDDARAGTVKRCSQRAADAARRADQPDDAA
jgi:excinuclease UvrABC nuclease subunit